MMRHVLLLIALGAMLAGCGKQEAVEPESPSAPMGGPMPAVPDRGPRPLPGAEALALEPGDGAHIHANYLSAEGQPRGAVVLLHQLNRIAEDWNPLMSELAKAGLASVAIDLRGHQRSFAPGNVPVAEFTPAEWQAAVADVGAAVEAVAEIAPEVPVFLVGASIGANLCTVYASRHPEQIAGLMLLSPGLDYRGVQTLEPMGQLGTMPVWLRATLGDAESAGAVEQLAAAAPGEVDSAVTDGAAHGTNLFEEQPELIASMVAWLTAHLD